MTKPLYFYNGTTFELVGPTTPQSPIAYQTSAPTAPATGDLWIDSDGDVDTYNRQLTRYYFVATAGQTSVTGVDANGLTLAYVAGSEAVYVNGALQVRGVDYTATNGTSITGLSALGLNDVVEVFAYTAFTVANAYTKSETDSVAAAAPGLRLVVPTSVAVGSGTGSANSAGFVTFSGASSVSLNGVFSSTYDNYRIVFTTATTSNIFMRLRVSNADETTSQYVYVVQGLDQGNTADNASSGGAGNTFHIGKSASSLQSSISLDMYSPKLSAVTSYTGTSMNRTGTATMSNWDISGLLNTTTSYDSVSIYNSSSNPMTGTVAVYGYKD